MRAPEAQPIDTLILEESEIPGCLQNTCDALSHITHWQSPEHPSADNVAYTLEHKVQAAVEGEQKKRKDLCAHQITAVGNILSTQEATSIDIGSRGVIALGLRSGACVITKAHSSHAFSLIPPVSATSGLAAASASVPAQHSTGCSAVAWSVHCSSRASMMLHSLPLLALGTFDGSITLLEPSKCGAALPTADTTPTKQARSSSSSALHSSSQLSSSSAAVYKELRQSHPSAIQAIACVHLRSGPEIVAADTSGNVRRHSLSAAGVVVWHRVASLGVHVFAQDIHCIIRESDDTALAAVETNASVAIVHLGSDASLIGRPAKQNDSDPGPRACWLRDVQEGAESAGLERILISWGQSATLYCVSSSSVDAERQIILPFEPIAIACLHSRLAAAVASVGSIVGLSLDRESTGTNESLELDRLELGSYITNDRHGFSSFGPFACALTSEGVFHVESGAGFATVDNLIQRELFADALACMLRTQNVEQKQALEALNGIMQCIVGVHNKEELELIAHSCIAFATSSGLRKQLLANGTLGEMFQSAGNDARKAFAYALWPLAQPEDIASPDILRDVLQQLQEQGEFLSMQKLLLNAPIESIDLDQGLRACNKLQLHVASTRIFHDALGEYVDPIKELLAAHDRDIENASKYEDELQPRCIALVSIWLIARGKTFPTGRDGLKRGIWKRAHADVLRWLAEEKHSVESGHPLWALCRPPANLRRAAADVLLDSVARQAIHATAEELATTSATLFGRIIHTLIHIAQSRLQSYDQGKEAEVDAALELLHSAGQLCCKRGVYAQARAFEASVDEEDLMLLLQLLQEHASSQMWAVNIFAQLAALGATMRSFVLDQARAAQIIQVEALCSAWDGNIPKALQVLLSDNCAAHVPFAFINALLGSSDATSMPSYTNEPVYRFCGVPSENDEYQLKQSAVSLILSLAKKDPALTAEFCMKHVHSDAMVSSVLQALRSDSCIELHVLRHAMRWGERSIMQCEGQTRLIELLCEQQSASVRDMLALTSACDLQRCLDATRSHNVPDATAVLLERVGDVDGALGVHLQLLAQQQKSIVHSPENDTVLTTARSQLSEAINVCIRGVEYFGSRDYKATSLWFRLLDQCVEGARVIQASSKASTILEQHLETALTRTQQQPLKLNEHPIRSPLCLVPLRQETRLFVHFVLYERRDGE